MKKYVITIALFTLLSCVYDSTTIKVDNYDWAFKTNLFERGWIPKSLINKQMKNIYIKNNSDTNDFYFRYNIPQKEIGVLEPKLTLIKKENIKYPANILKLGNTELSKLKMIDNYRQLIESNDTIIVAIDAKNSTVYGWNLK